MYILPSSLHFSGWRLLEVVPAGLFLVAGGRLLHRGLDVLHVGLGHVQQVLDSGVKTNR